MNSSKNAAEKLRPSLPIRFVLDASALLAALWEERGCENVLPQMSESCISAVNLTETAAKLIRKGSTEAECMDLISSLRMPVIAYDELVMRGAVPLSPFGWTHGLSLADRTCIATAAYLGLTAVTADARWVDLNLPCPVLAIR